MEKYIKYLQYVLRHKWYVMQECFKEGLFLRGIMHDMSKLRPSEFIPYANYFYGKKDSDIGKGRNSTGYYKPTDTGDKAFDFAWLLHQKRNKHHWQWWCLAQDEDGLKILDMELTSILEMICDWVGAGKAQGHFSPKSDRYFETRKWYDMNKNKLQLSPETRKIIEVKIGYSK